jgi:hypothetical protein
MSSRHSIQAKQERAKLEFVEGLSSNLLKLNDFLGQQQNVIDVPCNDMCLAGAARASLTQINMQRKASFWTCFLVRAVSAPQA